MAFNIFALFYLLWSCSHRSLHTTLHRKRASAMGCCRWHSIPKLPHSLNDFNSCLFSVLIQFIRWLKKKKICIQIWFHRSLMCFALAFVIIVNWFSSNGSMWNFWMSGVAISWLFLYNLTFISGCRFSRAAQTHTHSSAPNNNSNDNDDFQFIQRKKNSVWYFFTVFILVILLCAGNFSSILHRRSPDHHSKDQSVCIYLLKLVYIGFFTLAWLNLIFNLMYVSGVFSSLSLFCIVSNFQSTSIFPFFFFTFTIGSHQNSKRYIKNVTRMF